MNDEIEQARLAMRAVIADPKLAPTSLLLSLYVGLVVGKAFGLSGVVEGLELDRDEAAGRLALEIDRRIPVP